MLVCFAFCTLVHRKPEIGTSETVTLLSDMEFVKNFTPSISPNFNSFSEKKHKKWVKMEKFTPLAKILHSRRDWRDGQIPPLQGYHTNTNATLKSLSHVMSSQDWMGVKYKTISSHPGHLRQTKTQRQKPWRQKPLHKGQHKYKHKDTTQAAKVCASPPFKITIRHTPS